MGAGATWRDFYEIFSNSLYHDENSILTTNTKNQAKVAKTIKLT